MRRGHNLCVQNLFVDIFLLCSETFRDVWSGILPDKFTMLRRKRICACMFPLGFCPKKRKILMLGKVISVRNWNSQLTCNPQIKNFGCAKHFLQLLSFRKIEHPAAQVAFQLLIRRRGCHMLCGRWIDNNPPRLHVRMQNISTRRAASMRSAVSSKAKIFLIASFQHAAYYLDWQRRANKTMMKTELAG